MHGIGSNPLRGAIVPAKIGLTTNLPLVYSWALPPHCEPKKKQLQTKEKMGNKIVNAVNYHLAMHTNPPTNYDAVAIFKNSTNTLFILILNIDYQYFKFKI